MQINGNGISSALLIDETSDAATPFEGSLEVRKLFPHSVLLAEPGGTTHADSLFGDLCVDNTIANYLASGQLPARNPNAKWDKTCKPLPRPNPSASSSRRLTWPGHSFPHCGASQPTSQANKRASQPYQAGRPVAQRVSTSRRPASGSRPPAGGRTGS